MFIACATTEPSPSSHDFNGVREHQVLEGCRTKAVNCLSLCGLHGCRARSNGGQQQRPGSRRLAFVPWPS